MAYKSFQEGFRLMGYRSFEELEVWKLGCRLAVRVYEVLKECSDFGA